jgi:FkbM family methyltransferase
MYPLLRHSTLIANIVISSIFNNLLPGKIKRQIKTKLGVPSQEDSLKRIKTLGFNPQFCLDIGAYEGCWAREFKSIFPGTSILMLEGQNEKERALINTKKQYKDVDYRIALLGANESLVTFNKYETASSVLGEHHATGAQTEIRKLSSLDSVVSKTPFEKPDFIKIDTQGYELEVLKGGQKTLTHAEFVLLEVSMLDIYKEAPLVADVIGYMRSKNFVLYDICTLMKRPLDGALFQSDFLFVKESSVFRQDKRWS